MSIEDENIPKAWEELREKLNADILKNADHKTHIKEHMDTHDKLLDKIDRHMVNRMFDTVHLLGEEVKLLHKRLLWAEACSFTSIGILIMHFVFKWI
jgi:hypothetical protein